MAEKQIVKTAVVSKPIKEVWRMWTTHEGLLTFFGADNNIEMTPGGAYEIYFIIDNPYGQRGSEGCRVLSFLPERMLSFSWNAPPQFAQIRESEYKTWVVVELEEIGKSETKVTLTHLGWPDDKKWDKVYNYFDEAWDVVLARLKSVASKSG